MFSRESTTHTLSVQKRSKFAIETDDVSHHKTFAVLLETDKKQNDVVHIQGYSLVNRIGGE